MKKTASRKSRPSSAQPAASFLNTQMNWWVGLALVLPQLISYTSMDVTLPRFMALSLFLLAFVGYFYFFRAGRLELPRPHGWNEVLGVLALSFLGIMILSSLFAVNKQEAMYWTVRYLLLVAATGLFVLTALREEPFLDRLCKAVAVVLVVQSLVALLQFYELAFTELPPPMGFKPYGLMANRNLLGSFLALLCPFCAYVIYAGDWKWRIVGGTALWLGTYGIILSQTRSSWLTLAAGIVVSSLLVLGLRSRLGGTLVQSWFRGVALFVVGVFVAAALALVVPERQGLIPSLKQRTASLAQLANAAAEASSTKTASNDATPTATTSIAGRFYFWKESLAMMRDHPVLGLGPGNWRVAAAHYGFHRYIPGPLVVADHAHNVYLQAGAETGIAGFLVHGAIWLCALLCGLKVVVQSQDNDRRMLALMVLTALCMAAVDSLASFPNDSITHCVFIVFAFGIPAAMYHRMGLGVASSFAPVRLSRAFLILPLAFCLFCFCLGRAKSSFEAHARRALGYQGLSQYEQMLVEAEAGSSPLVSLAPRGFPMEVFSGAAYAGLGQMDKALEAMQRARELNPGSVPVLVQMAAVYTKMGLPEEAIRCYQEALQMAPHFMEPLFHLATLYYNKGLYKECRETLLNAPYQEAALSVAMFADACLKLEDYQGAVPPLREGVRKFPDSLELNEKLAYLEYTQLNDYTNAYIHFRRVLEMSPNHTNREEYTKVLDYLAPLVGQKMPEASPVPPAH